MNDEIVYTVFVNKTIIDIQQEYSLKNSTCVPIEFFRRNDDLSIDKCVLVAWSKSLISQLANDEIVILEGLNFYSLESYQIWRNKNGFIEIDE